MRDHFVYISSGGLIALRASGGLLELSGRFDPIGGVEDPATVPRTQAFRDWLARYRNDRFRIIVDTSEEEITLDELPPLMARDRLEMSRKRVDGRYREQRFKTCMPFALLGERPTGLAAITGRRASSFVISVLRSELVLSPWVQIIERSQVSLASLHSTALLAPALLASEFKGKSGLLVSLQPGGLRQTLVVKGVLRFSRLAPVYQVQDAAGLVAEIDSTMQYMAMSQIVNRELLNGDFSVWLIDAGLPETEGRQVLLSESGEPRSIIRVGARLKTLPLDDEAQQSNLGAIPWWASSLRSRQVGAGYATSEQRVYARVAQLRKGLKFGSAGLATACLLGAGGLELFRQMRPDPTGLLRKYENLIVEKEQELLVTQAEYGVTGSELNLLTQAAHGLRQRHVDAAALLTLLSESVGAELDLRLDRIAWRRVGSESGLSATAASGGGSQAPVALAATAPAGAGGPGGPNGPAGLAAGTPGMAGTTAGGVSPMGAGAVAGMNPDSGKAPTLASQVNSEIIVEIQGKAPNRIGKTESNRRASDLVARLRKACGCEVELVRWPFDNAPPSSLSGDFKTVASTDQAPFEIRMKLGAGPVSLGGAAAGTAGQDASDRGRRPRAAG